MLSNTLELTLRKALHLASSYKHEYATYEHLLLALMEDEDVKLVLIEKDINPRTISKKLSYCQMLCIKKIRQHIFSHLSCRY